MWKIVRINPNLNTRLSYLAFRMFNGALLQNWHHQQVQTTLQNYLRVQEVSYPLLHGRSFAIEVACTHKYMQYKD
jgi:hypothetical protein